MHAFVSWRMVSEILPSKEEFLRALRSGQRLRFYFGIDPTSPDLHLGHAVSLWFLRDMQRLGHEVIVLLGDFTALIGDPTGKDVTRRPLSPEEVRRNMRSYRRQIGALISFTAKKNPAKLMRNSRWLSRLRLPDVIRLAGHVTVQQLLEREMFQRRMRMGKPIALHEFLYPLLQGYDSVALDADVEVGGADQLFNMMVGKKLREAERGKSKFVIAMRLIEDSKTGRKMSKTEGNYVPLGAAPDDLYGKVMALPDGMVWPCIELATDMTDNEIRALRQKADAGTSMRDIKAVLAERIVATIHGARRAKQARDAFERTFVRKLPPTAMPVITVARRTAVFLPKFLAAHGLAASRSDAIRLIEEGGVAINDRVVRDWRTPMTFERGGVLRIGKKKFFRIRIE